MILFSDRHKQPIKREDIKKTLKEFSSKKFKDDIMRRASQLLKDIFGFQLIDISTKSSSKTTNSRTSSHSKSIEKNQPPSYILHNCVERKGDLWKQYVLEGSHVHSSEQASIGLLMLILCFIHLNEAVIEHTMLYDQLKWVGLKEKEKDEVFGDWEKLIDKFVKQSYLKRTRIPNRDDKTFEYRMGPRALIEIDENKISQFVNKIFATQNSTTNDQNSSQSNSNNTVFATPKTRGRTTRSQSSQK